MTTNIKRIVPNKLTEGSCVAVLALSRTIGGIMQQSGLTSADIEFAKQRLEKLGLKVVFGSHVMECNSHLTTAPEARIKDLHSALSNPAVDAILAVS